MNKINYEFIGSQQAITLNISAEEKFKHQLSTALHYDTFQKIGVLFNYTGRNILAKSSRLVLGVDIAEQPKLRVAYQKNFGKEKALWWRAQVFKQRTKQKYYSNGYLGESLTLDYFKTKYELNKNINALESYYGVDLNYETFDISPEFDPSLNNNVYNVNHYHSSNFEISSYFKFNTLNKPFFATLGNKFDLRLSRALRNYIEVEYVSSDLKNTSGLTDLYTRITGQFENRKAINKSVTLISLLDFGLTFIDSSGKIGYLRHGQGSKFALGGFLNQNQQHQNLNNQ